jgi:hypothetical protein
MTKPWDVSLFVDAVGQDEARVRVGRGGHEQRPHLTVRTGLVLVYCIDAAAAMSAAQAWAAARVRISDWLPTEPPARPARVPGYGQAHPASSVIFEGRQPWNLSTRGEGLTVTVGCLSVRVRDWTALDTHVRAWSEASAVAMRIFPGRAVPFTQLVQQARISSIQRAAGERQRRGPRRGVDRD